MKRTNTTGKWANRSVFFAFALGLSGSVFAADDYNLRTLAVTNPVKTWRKKENS